jgi:hypothetical protein
MQILDLYAGSNKRTIRLVNPPELDRDFFGDNDDEQTSRLAALLFHLEEDFFITFDGNTDAHIFLGTTEYAINEYEDYVKSCGSDDDEPMSFYDWCDSEMYYAADEWDYDTYRCEFNRGNQSYLVMDANEVDDAVKEYVKDSVWAFNASFIVSHCNLPWEMEEIITAYQSEKCEDANKMLLALIHKCGNFDEFVKEAVEEDGAAHFLSSYDGKEHEVFINHFTSSPPTNNVVKLYEYYIYRTN